ncbi:hypothetical protein [Lederbergia graminis]|uniref:NADH dehydrogenase subunit 6 n=1 Tax=Lederbergia graminis TaxID=735518 RepID=A0ABW0LEC1_9BACI
MEGSLYLLFIWVLWIYSTFIMEKSKAFRLPIAAFALIMIIFHPVHFSVMSLQISGSSIILLLICYYLTSKFSWRQQLHLLFAVFALMVGYAGFLLLELYDPVMIFIDRKILLSFLLLFISYVIYPSSIIKRCIFVCLGSLQGDIVFAAILSRMDFPYIVGSLEYMDIIVIVSAAFICIETIMKLSKVPKINKMRKISQ